MTNQSQFPKVWCTGIKLNPLCEKIMDAMPEGAQENRRSIATDKSLRVKGSEGTIFAIGKAVQARPRLESTRFQILIVKRITVLSN